jgi:hypothetical protein
MSFFMQLKRLPTDIQSRIWADYFRLAAETHADNFAAVHDEMTNYSLRVTVADKIKLTLCNANLYYSIVDIDDLWLNAYIFKHVLEIQIKIDCLRILEVYKWCYMKQPTVRFGDVIVRIDDSLYEENGHVLDHYLRQIPGVRDYVEDRLAYERRFRQIEWLTYVDDCWLESGAYPPTSQLQEPLLAPLNAGSLTPLLQNNGNSRDGRGVSGLALLNGLGAVGLDSGQIGADLDIDDSSESDNDGGDSSDNESWRNWSPEEEDNSTDVDTGTSGGEETGAGGFTG